MSLRGLRIGFLLFFGLSTYVAVNLLLLQPDSSAPGRLAGHAQKQNTTAIETASLKASERARQVSVRSERGGRGPASANQGGAREARHVLMPGTSGVRGRFLPVNTSNSGELVRALQRELKIKGYDPGAEDGNAGLVTQASIFAFQYDNHLALTAEPSEKLLQSLVLGQSGPKPPTTARTFGLSASARDLVRTSQRGLKSLGYWPSSVDGHFNTQMSRAIQRFETAQRLPTTGRISGRFMARLMRLSGVGMASKAGRS